VLTTPDTAAQLMELREPVTLGVLDQHHGRVGDIDADLDDRRRDEYVGFSAREARHRLRLLVRAHLTVQQDDAIVRELARAQALELGGRGTCRQCF